MMTSDSIEALERGFWRGDTGYYRTHLAADAAMVFPEPVGVMDRGEIIASIAVAPRWTDVAMTDARQVPLSGDAVAFVYRAKARRQGETSAYEAYCSSVYVQVSGEWRLALHQQTPIN